MWLRALRLFSSRVFTGREPGTLGRGHAADAHRIPVMIRTEGVTLGGDLVMRLRSFRPGNLTRGSLRSSP
jgi:hypothetical protein